MQFWYVSKYAGHPELSSYLRHYSIAKYLAMQSDKEVTLIFSRSSILSKIPEVKGHFKVMDSDGFKQIILNGPAVGMGFNLKRIWSWFWFEFQFIRFTFRSRIKPDVLLVSSLSILTFLSGVFLKRMYGCTLLVEVRDIYPLTLTELSGFSKRNPFILFLQWIERKAYLNADAIISTLYAHREHVRRICPGAETKCHYIPMGFDPEIEADKMSLAITDDCRVLSETLEGKFVVGYIGSFGVSQATEVIFDAIQIMKDDPIVRFLIVGSGPEKEKGLKRVEGCKNFICVDRVPHNQVPSYVSLCDVLLNPWLDRPIYQFGVSPNKWIDYMRSAKPFIVGLRNSDPILQRAGCAESIPSEDPDELVKCIRRFQMKDREALIDMGRRGREYLENNMSYPIHAATLADIVDGLCIG